jgi:Na+-transporting methylmalonyl-CoA/oxaloacetate decarboxylase gamma subunit
MHFIPILAVAEKAHVSVMDALPYTVGALVVIATLTTLWGVCALTAKLIQVLIPEPAAPAPKTAPAAPAPAVGIAPEIVAVVAAAVATATGKSHRIVSIKRQSTGWEKAGRQSVLTSHKIR